MGRVSGAGSSQGSRMVTRGDGGGPKDLLSLLIMLISFRLHPPSRHNLQGEQENNASRRNMVQVHIYASGLEKAEGLRCYKTFDKTADLDHQFCSRILYTSTMMPARNRST